MSNNSDYSKYPAAAAIHRTAKRYTRSEAAAKAAAASPTANDYFLCPICQNFHLCNVTDDNQRIRLEGRIAPQSLQQLHRRHDALRERLRLTLGLAPLRLAK